MIFVGNGALAVPFGSLSVNSWNAEGGVPYKIIFIISKN